MSHPPLLERCAPFVAQPIQCRTAQRGKRKLHLTWEEFAVARDAFSWLIFPMEVDGTCCHCFAAVDDLIFDASTKKVLKRTVEMVKFICGGKELDFQAGHFCLPTANAQARQGHAKCNGCLGVNWVKEGEEATATSAGTKRMEVSSETEQLRLPEKR